MIARVRAASLYLVLQPSIHPDQVGATDYSTGIWAKPHHQTAQQQGGARPHHEQRSNKAGPGPTTKKRRDGVG